ncbi:MAG: glutaredoxin 3 [Betaproteobacteria bacterium]
MSAAVVMSTTAVCPYCQRAEQLLRARGVEHIEKVRIDLEPSRRDEMMQRTGRRTVPQIYIGDHHVGGFDDLAALDRAGGLTPMLTSV